MQITNRSEAKSLLIAGDRVTCSISHELKIDGEASWVKFEINTSVLPDEQEQQAVERVIALTNKAVMEAVHTAVDTVKGQS